MVRQVKPRDNWVFPIRGGERSARGGGRKKGVGAGISGLKRKGMNTCESPNGNRLLSGRKGRVHMHETQDAMKEKRQMKYFAGEKKRI